MDPPRIIQRWIHSSWDLPRLVSIQLKYSGSIQRGILSRHSALSNSGAIPLRIGLLEIIPYEAYPTRDSSYRSPTLDPINSGSISHASTTLPLFNNIPHSSARSSSLQSHTPTYASFVHPLQIDITNHPLPVDVTIMSSSQPDSDQRADDNVVCLIKFYYATYALSLRMKLASRRRGD
jgi:hypothetical protein